MKRITLALAVFVAGCHFDVGKATDDMGMGGGDVDMAGGAGSGGGGGGGDVDMSMDEPDMTMVCTPGAKSCAGSMLTTCNPAGTGTDTTACALGCNAGGTDCLQLYPAAPAMPSDFVYAGLSTPNFTQPQLVFDTDTGEIKDGAGTTVRMPNPSPTSRFVENGIGFHRTGGVGIWTFSALTIPLTTTVTFKSQYGASLLSVGDITVAGTIDARGHSDPSNLATLCAGNSAGPGGGVGGSGANAAGGLGAGAPGANDHAGGAGASYGAKGGNGGGDNGGNGGGAPANSYGATTVNPLVGGSGGGAGGSATGAPGGGGGGVVQLAAQGTITISGTVNAGGCGGSGGVMGKGGGGGGSGGAIVVEAPVVHVTASGIVAANGGAGGGGDGGMAGQPGPSSASTAAAGGTPGNQGGVGGTASITGTPVGGNADNAGNPSGGGGGGGGGAGYLRFNTKPSMLTFDGGSQRSPRTNDGLNTAGTVDIH